MSDFNNIIFRGNDFYNIYYYNGQIFKVVGFKHFKPDNVIRVSSSEKNSYDTKLANSISRTKRIVLDYALCNDWKFFGTFTLDKNKYNRYDLPKFRKDFSQWIRDQRKKHPNIDFKYLLVPEMHKDGAWHMHGLLGDISPLLTSFKDLSDNGFSVPYNLVKGGFFRWTDYSNKFGFCSLGVIKNSVKTAFYLTKYISKQLIDGNIALNARSVYNSYGLNKPYLHNTVYGYTQSLEDVFSFRGEFCSTGMTKLSDSLDWTYSFDLIDYPLVPLFGDLDFNDNVAIGDSGDMFYQMHLGVDI